ncbi:MAG TPA: hypothetical protein VG387_05705 [Rhizomicrobium sp.]|jgi:hypothetical protein|nr:hypothetical protein [Rhizomicrobium sp.]
MRRIAGVVLVLIGLLPLAAAAIVWAWARYTYTVGLSADLQGKAALAGLAATAVACLGLGTWLLWGGARSAA